MSRPNHASALGVARASFSTAALGSTLVNREGQIAMSRKMAIRTAENQNTGFFLSWRQASDARERASSWWPGTASAPVSTATAAVDASVMANPRVEHAVQQ